MHPVRIFGAIETKKMTTEATPIFPKLNVEEEPELGATEIESMCMNCHENVS